MLGMAVLYGRARIPVFRRPKTRSDRCLPPTRKFQHSTTFCKLANEFPLVDHDFRNALQRLALYVFVRAVDEKHHSLLGPGIRHTRTDGNHGWNGTAEVIAAAISSNEMRKHNEETTRR